MERQRGERPGDRFGDHPAELSNDIGRQQRMLSRIPSGSPTNQHHRHHRGGVGGVGGGESFSGGRYHPYRAHPEFPPAGFRAFQGFRDGPGGFGGHQMPMGGNKRAFEGIGGSPDYSEGNKIVKLFIGSVPRTATEEDIRPLFEEHGDVVEVALIRDKRTGQQQVNVLELNQTAIGKQQWNHNAPLKTYGGGAVCMLAMLPMVARGRALVKKSVN